MELTFTVAIPVIIAFVGIVKKFEVEKKYLPLVAVVFGVVGGFFAVLGMVKMPEAQDYFEYLFKGLIAGLAASGLYDHKALFKKE